MLVGARLCSQDTFVPGDARPVRYVEGESGRLSVPVAWALGTRTVAAQGNGGSADLRWAPRTQRPRPGLSSPVHRCLTPHPKCVQIRDRAGAAARHSDAAPRPETQPNRRPPAPSTQAAPEAPARPLTPHPQAHQPPLTSQSGRRRRQSPALSSPVRRGLLSRCGVPWLTPARQPGR